MKEIFKVGDKVRCINSSENKIDGSGWELNLEFTITSVDNYSTYCIYFGGKNGHGVFSHSCELVKPEVYTYDSKGYLEEEK